MRIIQFFDTDCLLKSEFSLSSFLAIIIRVCNIASNSNGNDDDDGDDGGGDGDCNNDDDDNNNNVESASTNGQSYF